MGTVADSALGAGGEVIGVIPQALVEREIAHTGLTELYIVKTMHERKMRMAELSDAFIALPGGFGTLEEFCEVLTWNHLRIHDKACGLLNTRGYYDGLLGLFDHGVAEGFMRPSQRAYVVSADSPELLLDRLHGHGSGSSNVTAL
jgi:uncharacterized protein (TIGR00730 family)